ncbi:MULTISPECIES: DMT family transporter [Sphingomonas]|uniref:DMT family transporter n=1 Tax=Sphingomonas TaxID=13687 RepID=UPI000F7F8F95|nr:DMT family transporter [Sphingomonas sp. ABOLF]RSV11559.1 DMT family transporter [Sphingomonas sp. ABOLF]GLK22219.1 membrane protein [Microbacterium terregens]
MNSESRGTGMGLAAAVVANLTLAMGPWLVRLAETGPVAAGFWRLALAMPALLAWSAIANPGALRRGLAFWPVLLVAGLAFAADLATWNVSIHRTTLANATLFANSATLIYPVYGFLIARAWPSRPQVAALLLAMVGGGMLLGQSAELSHAHLVGDLLALFAGLAYAVYFIGMARVRAAVPPMPALALSGVATMAPLLVLAIGLGERLVPLDVAGWGPLIGLALVSQVFGQGLMIYALGRLPPLVIGITLLLQPIVAGGIGWAVYGERPGTPDLIGALLVAAALVLVRREPKVAPAAGQTRSVA